jgi:hypothetical protein
MRASSGPNADVEAPKFASVPESPSPRRKLLDQRDPPEQRLICRRERLGHLQRKLVSCSLQNEHGSPKGVDQVVETVSTMQIEIDVQEFGGRFWRQVHLQCSERYCWQDVAACDDSLPVLRAPATSHTAGKSPLAQPSFAAARKSASRPAAMASRMPCIRSW